jgi:hypothetical protein
MAMFTLHNGSVSVALGNALLEQVTQAFDSFHEDEKNRFLAWIKPAATGSLQRVLQPVAIEDFDARTEGDNLQIIAWIRARGLRLAPIMLNWKQVDNPVAAQAFVTELQARREAVAPETALDAVFDYWLTWLVLGALTVAVPLLYLRLLRRQLKGDRQAKEKVI